MPQEIEVKYLIKEPLFSLDDIRHVKIRQGYIVDAGERVVRIRQKGNSYYLTVKGIGLISRQEVEVELQKEQFDELWTLTVDKRIEKTRYLIDYPPHLIELDVFEGHLNGLVVAEVEFENETQVRNFIPPDWFEKEVTFDNRYQNSNLAKTGIPQ